MLNMIIQGGRIVATVIYPYYHLSLRNDWNSARAFGSLFGISKNSVTSKGTQSCPLLTFKACTFLVKFQSVYITRWLDCCNSLLAYTCIPSNLCNWSRMQQQDLFPKFSQITPLLCSHPWLPVVAHIRFKTLMPTKPKMDRPGVPEGSYHAPLCNMLPSSFYHGSTGPTVPQGTRKACTKTSLSCPPGGTSIS